AGSTICYLAVRMKGKLGYDDLLDAFGVHGVGGMIGAILTGVFATANTAQKGLIYGDSYQFEHQLLGAGVGAGFAVIMTILIAGALKFTLGLRATDAQERDGLDITLHGERGYHADLMS
ncbi:MAG TPA: hypothetical protein VK157_13465, partial [Phycisphaerales bacterium]|nr:hypothetical protein [Phycisphaerales bacterium]